MSAIPQAEAEAGPSGEFLPRYLNLLGSAEIAQLRPALEVLRDRRDAVIARWHELYLEHFTVARTLERASFEELFGQDLDALVRNLLEGDLEGFETDMKGLARRLMDNGVTFDEVVASLHLLEESAGEQFHTAPTPLDGRIYQWFDKLSHCRMIILSRTYFEGRQAEAGARIHGLEAEVKRLAGDAGAVTRFHGLVGSSPSMRELFRQIKAASRGQGSVLIAGESGTGKELVARALHELAGAPRRPFVAVNCAALPRELIESELFGHGKGAYTGAQSDHLGLIRAASGGTLFLDEVTEMPPETQAKLLRVIENHTVRPVGALREIEVVNLRFVAATNRDPEKAVTSGMLREDLYHRLGVFRLTVDPLRERPQDIPLLTEHFLDLFARRGMRSVEGFEPEALETLKRYRWPGNVRELRNAVEQALTVSGEPRISKADLPAHIVRGAQAALPAGTPEPGTIPTMEEAEDALIVRALKATDGNKLQAARMLQISRHRLYDRLRKLNLEE